MTRIKLQQELTRIWQVTKNTIFFITHNVEEAVYLGDRVAVMSTAPGSIRETHTIAVPRPRHYMDPVLGQITAKIYRELGVQI